MMSECRGSAGPGLCTAIKTVTMPFKKPCMIICALGIKPVNSNTACPIGATPHHPPLPRCQRQYRPQEKTKVLCR
jgi:hypothetical protein